MDFVKIREKGIFMDTKDSTNDDNVTRLTETSDYITTAYGSLPLYRCEKCGCNELLDCLNFCSNCGREIIN